MSTTQSAPEPERRQLRSYVRRAGRITTAQARALRELWPKYGVEFSPHAADLDAIFGRTAPRLLEIGFGNGEVLTTVAMQRRDWDCVGIEVHEPGVGRAMLQAESAQLSNLRVFRHDAIDVLTQQIPDDSFDEIFIFFPDPWPKKRHHKRRLIQRPFAELLTSRLRSGGTLRLATDWQPYAEQIREVLDACPGLTSCAGQSGYAPRPSIRPLTRFERRGQRLGHAVWDLEYQKSLGETALHAVDHELHGECPQDDSRQSAHHICAGDAERTHDLWCKQHQYECNRQHEDYDAHHPQEKQRSTLQASSDEKDCCERARPGDKWERERKYRDVWPPLGLLFFGAGSRSGAGGAHIHHVERDQEQHQAAKNAKRIQTDAHRVEERTARERERHENESCKDYSLASHPAFVADACTLGERCEHRHEADWFDYHEEQHEELDQRFNHDAVQKILRLPRV